MLAPEGGRQKKVVGAFRVNNERQTCDVRKNEVIHKVTKRPSFDTIGVFSINLPRSAKIVTEYATKYRGQL